MAEEVDARAFGKLEAEVSSLRGLLEEVRTDLKIMKERDDKREGGLKILLAVAAMLGSSLTFVVKWVVDHIKVG